jgi:hypothetical protein
MKKKIEKLKKIYQNEKNKNIILVSFFLICYFIAGMIFKAGYDMKFFSDIEEEEERENVREYDYTVFIDGKKIKSRGVEMKNMKDIIFDATKADLEFRNYLGGIRLISVNDSSNFDIYVNGVKFEGQFLEENKKLEDESVINIITK